MFPVIAAAVVFGLGAVVLMSLTLSHIHLLRSIAFEWGLPAPARDSERQEEAGWVRCARTAASYLLITPGLHFLPQLVTASMLDIFVTPFTLFDLAFNVRLLWLALFALGLLLASITRSWLTVRDGVADKL